MKNYISVLIMALFVLTGCVDDRTLPTLPSDPAEFEAPMVGNAATGSMVLNFENAEDVFEELEWEPADFGVSLPVRYDIEVDVEESAARTEANFEDPFVLASGITTNSYTITVGEMNDAALSLGLVPFEEGTIQIRIVASVHQSETIDPIASAPISRTLTPYVTSFDPIYMIGQAVGGWDPALAVEVYGVGPSQYEVVALFTNSGADATFRFFEGPDWGFTSYNFPYFDGGNVDALFENASDGDQNLRFLGETGYYRISVNLNTKTISMEALDGQPTLFMVGSGVPEAGWGWTTPVEMTWIQDGVFEATTELLNEGEAAFRFFTIRDDWNSGRNYPYYEAAEYDIDSRFVNAADGDQNFKFTGETGTYRVVVNDIEKTIEILEAGTAGPPKYLVGDGTSAGWGWTSPVELVQVEAGVFVGTSTFNQAGAFRVFATNGDWNSGTNYPTYISQGYTINGFTNAMDGDSNFKLTDPDGTYVFTLDENAKTISITEPN